MNTKIFRVITSWEYKNRVCFSNPELRCVCGNRKFSVIIFPRRFGKGFQAFCNKCGSIIDQTDIYG